MTDAPRDVPANEMDRMAARLAEVLNAHTGTNLTPDMVSTRMIAEFAWAFGLEPEFRLVRRPTETTSQGGGDG